MLVFFTPSDQEKLGLQLASRWREEEEWSTLPKKLDVSVEFQDFFWQKSIYSLWDFEAFPTFPPQKMRCEPALQMSQVFFGRAETNRDGEGEEGGE